MRLKTFANGSGEIGQVVAAEPELQVAALRNAHGVLQGLGDVREQRRHVLRPLEVLPLAVASRAPGIVQHAALVDAHPGLVGLVVLGFEKAHVVGRDHGDIAVGRERQRPFEVGLFPRAAGALQLDIEALGEGRQPLLEPAPGLGVTALGEHLPDLAGEPAREQDEPLGGLIEPLPPHHRDPLGLPLGVAPGHDPGEVPVAALVLAQGNDAGAL